MSITGTPGAALALSTPAAALARGSRVAMVFARQHMRSRIRRSRRRFACAGGPGWTLAACAWNPAGANDDVEG